MANKVSFIIQFKDQFGRVAQKVDRQFKNIKKSADRANKSVVAFARKTKASLKELKANLAATGAAMTAAVTVPMALMSRSMINAASDAEETANKFKEVFKGIGPQANKTVRELSKGFGLATSTTQELLSDTGDLLVGLGLTREQALKMSASVVRLSADVSSFKNVQGGTARASEALTKALLGEREMLKETFKTAVLEEEVKKRARLIRLRDRKLTEQQAKALATLAIVTDRNKDAIGDLARTQNSYANVVRESQEATKEASESFGRLMLPMATKIAKVFTKIMNAINDLSPPMKKFVLILAGAVAVAGPLLLLLAGIGAAMAFISLPVLAVGAAIGALIVAGAMLAANWDEVVKGGKALWNDFTSFMSNTADEIGGFFVGMFENIKQGIFNFVNKGIAAINSLLGPLNFVAEKLGLDTVTIREIKAPTAPTQGVKGSINGQITVSASPGTQVQSTSMQSRGNNLDMGLNMAVGP